MIQPALGQYRFLKTYGEGLLAGLDPADAFTATSPGGHHPAWILGHLTFTGLGAVQLLGGNAAGFEDAEARFGIGSEPEAAGDDFESIRTGWDDAHARVEAAVRRVAPDRLALPNPREGMAAALAFPTIGEMAAFLLSGHEAIHIGQLSAWRRARGLPRLF